MPNKGYTTSDLVGAYIGAPLSPGQAEQSDYLTDAAEQFLDQWTGRPYGSGNAQTVIDEHYSMNADQYGVLQLRLNPIGAVIAVRRVPNGTSPGDDVEFQVRDLSAGTIFIPSSIELPASGFQNMPMYMYPSMGAPEARMWQQDVWVTYLSLRSIPPLVSLAATMLVAHWIRWSINPDQFGLTQYTLGQDIHAQMREPESIPTEVKPVLYQIKRWTLA